MIVDGLYLHVVTTACPLSSARHFKALHRSVCSILRSTANTFEIDSVYTPPVPSMEVEMRSDSGEVVVDAAASPNSVLSSKRPLRLSLKKKTELSLIITLDLTVKPILHLWTAPRCTHLSHPSLIRTKFHCSYKMEP